jgi:two-component system sensor histidine kinase KdpD
MAHAPADVLEALRSSSFLQEANRAIIALFDQPFGEEGQPPNSTRILVDWSADPTLPTYASSQYTSITPEAFSMYPSLSEPEVVEDIQADPRISPDFAALLLQIHLRSLVLFPLVASAQWYGLVMFAFPEPTGLSKEDLRHMRGLVDEAAVAIHNTLLLEAEAAARREAERANALKLKFLAMISHELRTPLQSIKGFASTLLADDVTWEQDAQHEFISTINQEADKLTELIDQLLDLSLLEAGTLRIQLQECALDDIMAAAMPQLQALTSRHSLVVDVPASLPRVWADRARIAQVITNLVSNAVKYSPAQTAITVSARLEGGATEVSVADQGPGIPVQDRDQLFHLFQRGDSAERRTRGAGLGLAICKGIVEAHGGRIWLKEGTGSTFAFTLPVVSG